MDKPIGKIVAADQPRNIHKREDQLKPIYIQVTPGQVSPSAFGLRPKPDLQLRRFA